MVWADLNPEDLFKRDVFDSYFAVMFIFAPSLVFLILCTTLLYFDG